MSGGNTFALRTGHTASLDAPVLAAIRRLADDVFGAVFDEHDWEHALGGVHAPAWAGDELAAHGAVVQRQLVHAGQAVRTGYVEAVAVREEHRGHGYGAAVMDALEAVIRGGYELGALGSTEAARSFYLARGSRAWRGQTFALTPSGVVRTASEDGSIYVLPVTMPLELDGALTCDWRDGDVW